MRSGVGSAWLVVVVACASPVEEGAFPDIAVSDIAVSDIAVADIAADTRAPDTSPADAASPPGDLGGPADAAPPTSRCVSGVRTCASLDAVRACSDDGTRLDVLPCEADTVCYLGRCQPRICSPEDPVWCDAAGRRRVCNGLGIDWTPLPCPGGSACEEGACVPIRPNVVLIVDTSDSMNDLYHKPGAASGSCKGPDCPPWDFPDCDDPAAPKSRLGRVKQALRQLFESPAAGAARLALQRFPQTPSHQSGCDHGYWGSVSSLAGHDDEQVLDQATLDKSLGRILIVPFLEDDASSDLAALDQWTDFEVTVEPTEQACDWDWDCPSGLCEGWPRRCQAMINPELRAVGSTPLGMSLFYAGEYLRMKVLVDGKPCDGDADCGSPHHQCIEGACRDPHAACRPTAIILFTDGQETSHEGAADFFNPVNQARRLHYGLSCASEQDCTHGAACAEGVCQPPEPTLSAPLPPIAEGAHHALGPDGLPRAVTVHVVDASNGGKGSATNAEIAAWGGGQHVPVDLADVDALVLELLTLLDAKQPPGCGP